MWLAYLIALVPMVLGGIAWMFSKKVVWWEWLIGCVAGLAISATFHGCVVSSMTGDVETWSGQVASVTHYPEWIEEYQEMHTRTVSDGVDSDGNAQSHTETYYTTEHRTHHECWEQAENYGRISDTSGIEKGEFDEIAKLFGGQIDVEKPHKSGFDGGDPNIYVVQNRTRHVIPLTITRQWENRVKAAPSVFSFAQVPEGVKVQEYPKNDNRKVSDRVMGTARGRFSTAEWDKMCSRLGPAKKVNLIVVGFDSADSQLGQWQEAKWIGGKKNDLVLCYGATDHLEQPQWAYVYGWTEKEGVKKSLQTILLEGPLGDELIPKIEREVAANYLIKDWSKFDYITVEPPVWTLMVLVAAMLLVQVGYWVFAFLNEATKWEDTFAGSVHNRFRKTSFYERNYQ